jgi:hypothetical protein
LFIVFAVLSIGKVNLGAGHDAGLAEMLTALAIILSAGGYGWRMNANDFSRYLALDTSTGKIVNAHPAWISPLTRATGGADASVLMGAVFAGALYFLLARDSVPDEAEDSALGDPPDMGLGTTAA